MPGKVKVRIIAGKCLPVMDRARDTCDAFVEVKFGNSTYKTDVYRHSLNPQWHSEWYRFEADDEELQDEPLQIRVMDYDTYSANDAIGKVYIDLNPLLASGARTSFTGWFPIYDTMHGIRGEINIQVKVELFSDSNKYRESSCGVQFFYSHGIPHGYRAQAILGFVEELVVNDDPEYQWIDKIRTPRASNEARQTLFSKLSGEVQRKIGLKALELGGNAVVAYQQCFDLEGESGIVVRGIGTAVILTKQHTEPLTPITETRESPVIEEAAHSPAVFTVPSAQKYSSDSDLSTTPKGCGAPGSSGSGSGGPKAAPKSFLPQDSMSLLEYPFITMKIFPPGLIQYIGGVVAAKSVKLFCQINNPDEPETRDGWWIELRKEVRSHAKALGCSVVLGYSESTNICDDVCILAATGTAAVLYTPGPIPPPMPTSTGPHDVSGQPNDSLSKPPAAAVDKPLKVDIHLANRHNTWDEETSSHNCKQCHIPYNENSIPFPVTLSRCYLCRKSKVPDVLFMTIEPPSNMPLVGKGCLIQSRVCRMKRESKGEQNAKEISDSLPFLEYELHKQLLNKLKVKGMNGLCALKIQVSVGEKCIIGLATGTGVYLAPLPPPAPPRVVCGKGSEASRILDIQKEIYETLARNREMYGIKCPESQSADVLQSHKPQQVEESTDALTNEDDRPDLDLSLGNKDPCILEVDDAEDVDIINVLMDLKTPEGFEFCNTETLPGLNSFICNLQMFIRIYRSKLVMSGSNCRQFSSLFDNILQSLCIKLRRLVPCCLASLNFHIDIPEQDELQLTILGVTVGLGDPSLLMTISKPKMIENDHELIFKMDEDKDPSNTNAPVKSHLPSHLKHPYHSPFKNPHFGVEMSPLSFIPGGSIERYLGNLNFFFIRETTSMKESGGLNGFIQSFVTEVLAIVRAHVAALGGNAVLSYHMTQCVLMHNPHKNQGQCLINVGGDAVRYLPNLPEEAP